MSMVDGKGRTVLDHATKTVKNCAYFEQNSWGKVAADLLQANAVFGTSSRYTYGTLLQLAREVEAQDVIILLEKKKPDEPKSLLKRLRDFLFSKRIF